jgi:hypothetical protein
MEEKVAVDNMFRNAVGSTHQDSAKLAVGLRTAKRCTLREREDELE